MPDPRKRRRRAGRPPLPPKERHDATLLIRLRPEELGRLRALAESAEQGVGQYARDVLRRHLRRAVRA
ncbi:MAG: hypothetical protein IT386_14795 [Deltaproteobacteria bacterium]|nr:hypothetical protein [Deltaproteobacteria bacterium]